MTGRMNGRVTIFPNKLLRDKLHIPRQILYTSRPTPEYYCTPKCEVPALPILKIHHTCTIGASAEGAYDAPQTPWSTGEGIPPPHFQPPSTRTPMASRLGDHTYFFLKEPDSADRPDHGPQSRGRDQWLLGRHHCPRCLNICFSLLWLFWDCMFCKSCFKP